MRATFPRAAAAFGALALAAGAAWPAVLCTASSTSMGLGTYVGDTSAPVDSIGAFTVSCDRSGGAATVQVTLGIGASASSGTIADRKLRWSAGTDLLAYNLYRDAGRLSVWGETPGVDTVTQSLTVPNHGTASTTFTIYGRINALQDVHPGVYGDDLVVTVNF